MDNLTQLLASGPASKRSCKVQDWMAALSEEDRISVLNAMGDSKWSTRELLDIFKQFGYPGARESMTLHRKGQCAVCGSL